MPLGELQVRTLRAAAERIVPADDTTGPGATGAGVVEYIIGQFERDFADLLNDYAAFLDGLDARANALYRKPFADLTPDRQDALLRERENDSAHASFFRRFVDHVQEGFYTSPVSWEMIGWRVKG